jgi:hypothetical protein
MLEFKEFMTSFEEMGIKLKLADFKMIFDALDYDSRGSVDFNKFCFLNADRYCLSDLQKRVTLLTVIFLLEIRVSSNTKYYQREEKTTSTSSFCLWKASSWINQFIRQLTCYISRLGKENP